VALAATVIREKNLDSANYGVYTKCKGGYFRKLEYPASSTEIGLSGESKIKIAY